MEIRCIYLHIEKYVAENIVSLCEKYGTRILKLLFDMIEKVGLAIVGKMVYNRWQKKKILRGGV